MGTPIGGFFDGASVVLATLAPSAAAPRIPIKVPIPFAEPVPIIEGTHTERVGETIHVPAETITPQKGVIPSVTIQTEVASLATPLIISISDPFVTLSQAMKDDSSLVVTPSSIPSSAIRGPDADLSSEGSEDFLEDSDDEPTMKKRVSNSEEEEGVDHEVQPMEVAADTDIPTATSPATPIASVSVVPSIPVSVISAIPIPTVSEPLFSQFEVGSSSAAVTDPVSVAVAFFTRFDQLEWRTAVQELISVGFAVEFILDHLRDFAQAHCMRRVQPAVDAINTRIEVLRKEVADLEARRERLLLSISESNRFGDQSLIFGLR
ncbi:hypothetical protein SO802_033184 [Lithocarpus litseifolius]|uniref:Uncharacterized protein n=1 Tax=Lithocarpus litseifolius TaxID=425828 RepID=A0AAW2BFT5_9ROSI